MHHDATSSDDQANLRAASGDDFQDVRPTGASDQERPISSRRRFLGRGFAATAAVAGASIATPGSASAAPPNLFPGLNRKLFQEIRSDENAHVSFLRNSLGANARPKATFKNLYAANIDQFIAMSVAFENTGAGAYTGAAPFINSPVYLSAASRIALVEGRHAAFLNTLQNSPLVPQSAAFENPLSQEQVGAAVSPFIASLNGGAIPTYTLARSDVNDLYILNYALLLEDLEAEFYNINVPRFYP